jgi:hypothetical protein
MLKEEIFSQEQAWVRVRDPRWYRALSLAERLESRQAVSAPQTGEEADQCELAGMRMEQWNSQLAFARGVDFAERLAADNMTEDDLLALLGESAEAIQRRTPVMSWMERLKSLFEDADVPDEAEWLTRLSTQKLSLLNSVDLFLQDGLQRLGESVSALVREYEQIPFHEERVVTLFLPALARPLIIAMNRTLVLELNVARLEDRLQGETPEERFQDFVRRIREKTGLLVILEEYPLLARQLLNIVDRWLNYTLEFLQHLCADWQDLRAIFSPESDPGLLTAVEGGAGDTHRGGRSVLKVKFSSGLQLVYKPKSLAIDVHFQELLRWLNERGYQPAFRVVRLLNRETYGWSEFVDSHGCESPEEVTRFYERQGGYLALLYALSATDFHFENLIAAGEHPVLIDLEALFHPYFAEEETNSSNSAVDAMR